MKNKNNFYNFLSVMTTVIILINTASIAQPPDKLWESHYKGALDGMDEANYIITDLSGNVFITGQSFQAFAGGDFTTVMYNGNGIQLWAEHFANTQSSYSNYGIRLVIDKWQNVYAVGSTALNDGDLAVCKYNSAGKIWAKSYEPHWLDSFDDFGIDIDIDSSGNFYALARVTSISGNLYDMYIMKCDSSGGKTWEVNYTGASEADYPVDLYLTPGGTVYTLLQSYNFFGTQSDDITTIQFLSNGVQNWFSAYNGAGDDKDYPTSMKVDEAENQYICGTTDSGSDNDMVVMKQNNFGTRLWSLTYNGTANGDDTAFSVTSLLDGNIVVTGKSKELLSGVIVDAIVTFVIDDGTIVWTNKYYGNDSLGASVSHMITDANGNIYICGFENLINNTKNGCIIKYDISGNYIFNISYDGGANLDDKFNSITLDNNNDILVTGLTFASATNSKFVTVKYGNISTGISSNNFEVKDFSLEQNYPNPFNPTTKINFEIPKSGFVTLKIYDITGKLVDVLLNESKNIGSYTLDFNGNNFSSGIYFYTLSTQDFTETKRMILLK
ncbi:MAG: T9SS type A sorting domain-containing protein [Ignavibacteria bacterium]|nr:T9SS type A sorting domain-containing protein [Ignavibacteria bacterium]